MPDHPEYDDRLPCALAAAKATPPLVIRELIKQHASTDADHESSTRQSYEELAANCYLDESVALPAPAAVVLVDDVLTEGKHFKVCQELIRA